MQVQSLKLDELELASLRGDLQEASCTLNFAAQTGRGKVSLLAPRFSGLRGESLSGGFRWERDWVRLEKVVLQQQRSKYEVHGDYQVPSTVLLPTSAADLARQQAMAAGGPGGLAAAAGRWRVQVNVPGADMQEIMPAARLLQNATSMVPSDYERAKATFLAAVQKAGLHASELNTQLAAFADRLQRAEDQRHGAGGGAAPPAGAAAAASFQLPSLQELRGQWAGSIQAYGGGSGATSCDFDVKGQGWQWGGHGLDTLVAQGAYHSEEGVQLQEVSGPCWGWWLALVTGTCGAAAVATCSPAHAHVCAGRVWALLCSAGPGTRMPPAPNPPATCFPCFPALVDRWLFLPQWRSDPCLAELIPPPASAAGGCCCWVQFMLKAGEAQLTIHGSLLCEQQNAKVRLTDFPLATLRPLFRAVPALQRAAPAVPAQAPPPVASPRPLGMLFNMVGKATRGLQDSAAADADSPINGLLFIDGDIKGSRDQPTGKITISAFEAAVGETRLAETEAKAWLDQHQHLSFSLKVVPVEGHRQSGYVTAEGMIPLVEQPASGGPVARGGPAAPRAQQQQQPYIRLNVQDGGMAILTSLTPDIRWQQGSAKVAVRLSGALDKPTITSAASISKATLDCPYLRFPLTNVSAEVQARDNELTVESLEARVGRKGHVRASGSLPIYPGGDGAVGSQRRLVAEASGVDLRVRNMYTGQYDASLVVTGSLAQPTVGGHMQLSRGTAFLVPQNAQGEPAG